MIIAKSSNATGDKSLGRLGSFLGFRFRRVQNKLSRDFGIRTADMNLRAGMFSSLEVITANPGISQTALSNEVGLDKSIMVSMIDELETRGWVVRARSKSDRRRYKLSVTEEGAAALNKMFEELAAVEEIGLAALTEEERELISRALDKVYYAYVAPGSQDDG